MQTDWLAKQGRKSCIIFFGGWGMDPNPFKNIPIQTHDLLMVSDYSAPAKLDLQDLSESYEQIHLIAWSMGVWAAPFFIGDQTQIITTATALNGSLFPIDDKKGINRSIFKNMINNFSSQTLHDFYANMFTDSREKDRFFENLPRRTKDNIGHELAQLWKHYDTHGPAKNIYDKKIIGSRDRIFTARNQVRCWGKEQCSITKAPHFPFYTWSSWDRIITL